jgi:hypothetical protein
MIAVQANFYDVNVTVCDSLQVSIANLNTTTPSGFRNFMATFLTESANYTGRVVLFHGDSHVFRLCNPTTLPNVQFLENPGSEVIGWVRANIDSTAANASNIFSFTYFPIPVVANPTAPVAAPATAPAAAPAAAPKAPVAAPVAAPALPPVKKYPKCGLLGFSLICPLKGCGLFGRLFRFCKKV